MDILERIIENLTSDEVRRFKILSNRFKADEEKKLIILFDAIRSGDYKAVEEDVITQLYGATDSKSKNSYYRLRNKLLSNIEKSLLFYHFNYKNSIESHSTVQLSILLRERALYKEAYHYLKKAEKIARSHDQFSLLEVIYEEVVKLAIHLPIDIEAIIAQRKENLKKMEVTRANNEALGIITQKLKKRNFSRSNKSESVIEMLEDTRKRLEEHSHIFQSASGKMLVFKTVSSILVQKAAYSELAAYLQNTFEDFNDNGLFDRDTHGQRLWMRVWRINSLQKLMRLNETSEELVLFAEELKMFKKQNFNEYGFYYYLSLINNQKMLGDLDKSSETLKEALAIKEIVQNEQSELYLLISLAEQYFNQSIFSMASETIRRIISHKGFNKVDEELQFYIYIFGMVNTYESRDYKYTDVMYKSFKKKFKQMIKDEFYAKAVKFLDIILRLNKAAMEGKKVFLKSAYKNFVSDFPSKIEPPDNQIIVYEIYLKAKLDEDNYYALLLDEFGKQIS